MKRLSNSDFIDFCWFELDNNKEWFEGYTSYSEADYDEAIRENLDELWDLYMDEYGGNFNGN